MIPVQDILRRTDNMLNDVKRVRWTTQERLDWLNESAGAILNRRPAAFTKTLTHTLVAGTKQEIPTGTAQLMDVIRNLNADNSPGRPVGIVDRKLLDDSDPDWHAARQASAIVNYTHDGRMPTTFYVYPPAKVGIKVEMAVAALPVAVDDVADSFDVAPEYMESVANYICYRCKIKDGEYANAQEAAGFYAAFQDSLVNQTQAVQTAAPESASI